MSTRKRPEKGKSKGKGLRKEFLAFVRISNGFESWGRRYAAAGEGESYNEQERNVQQDVKKYKNRKIQKPKKERLVDTIGNCWNLSDWQF